MAFRNRRSFSSSLTLISIAILFISAVAISDSNIHQLPRKISGHGKHFSCESWKFAVETNDAGSWSVVPARCERFVQRYMGRHRYRSDSAQVAESAVEFARSVKIAGDGKDAWVFDIDETLLSNLPYYKRHGYGTEPFDEQSFDYWVFEASAPALEASLKLYNELNRLGFTIFLLTGRDENQRDVTEKNLRIAGYTGWKKLFLRGKSDKGTTAVVYKSKKRSELKKEGYRIRGSCGDQWSDLVGYATAERSFKLPNPIYYIA